MRMIFRCDPALSAHLPRPVPARAMLPDWLRKMPAKAHSDIHGRDIRTIKQCPPFVDAMAYGIMIPLPCDVTVHDGILSWDWDHPALSVEAHPHSPISFHVPAQVAGTPFYDPEVSIVKFNSFWTIELEEGYALFATHPANRDDLPCTLTARNKGHGRLLIQPGAVVDIDIVYARRVLLDFGLSWSWFTNVHLFPLHRFRAAIGMDPDRVGHAKPRAFLNQSRKIQMEARARRRS